MRIKPYKDKDWLKERYLDKGRSCQFIALEYGGVSRMTIFRWLRFYRIKTRSKKEAKDIKGRMIFKLIK